MLHRPDRARAEPAHPACRPRRRPDITGRRCSEAGVERCSGRRPLVYRPLVSNWRDFLDYEALEITG